MVSDFVRDFFGKYPVKTFRRGKQLLLVGDKVNEVFYVQSGVIWQYDITASGEKVILNSFKKGAFLPMSNVINDVPCRYFCEVGSGSAEIRSAPAGEVLKMLKENPEVLYNLLARVYRGTDGLMERLNQIMSGTASARVWQHLVVSAERFGEAAEDRDVKKIKMTVGQIAEYTGLARETVSRELGKLKDQGLVNIPSQGVIWVDMGKRIS